MHIRLLLRADIVTTTTHKKKLIIKKVFLFQEIQADGDSGLGQFLVGSGKFFVWSSHQFVGSEVVSRVVRKVRYRLEQTLLQLHLSLQFLDLFWNIIKI